jgi:hypothetical protein
MQRYLALAFKDLEHATKPKAELHRICGAVDKRIEPGGK